MKIIRKEYIEHIDKWWRANNKDALFVLGVRYVGKTFLVSNWAKDNGISYTYFSQDDYDSIKSIFDESKERSFDTSVAIVNKLMLDEPLNELLIFDGVKPGDEIIVQIKKLCSSSKHRYILISDYGEYVFNNARFLPVGSIDKLIMKPLSFKEYCELRLHKYVIDSLKTVFSEEGKEYPFADQFEKAWNEYSNYGGFPSVVCKLLEQGMPSAEKELASIKNGFLSLVEDNIPFSSNLSLILNHYGNKRSKTYHRFVFSSLSRNGTYQRYKRAVEILKQTGIIEALSIEGDALHFDYCDLYLCDPGLERIWSESPERYHVVESIVLSFGQRKKYKASRLVIDKDKVIDLVFDTFVPWLIDIKLKNTNSQALSALKLKNYIDSSNGSFKSYILIDKGMSCLRIYEKAAVLPVWAFLLVKLCPISRETSIRIFENGMKATKEP